VNVKSSGAAVPCPMRQYRDLSSLAVAAPGRRSPRVRRLDRSLAEPVIGDEVGVRAQPELAALARARPRPTD
jgi:hypothetical protein